MASIFTRIIQGEIPCYKIAETDQFLAFLDINPLTKGHTLVIPKVEIDYLFDLEDNLLAEMNVFAKKVARAIDRVMDCKRVGVAVLGLEVPHAHIHLIPINNLYDIEFSKPKLKLSGEEFEEIASSIRSSLEK
jgi:histidine triad (HIT) family protein